MYSITKIDSGVGSYQWAVVDSQQNIYSNNLMPENDAALFRDALNRALSLQTRLDGIFKAECPVPTITNENVLEEANRLIYADRAQSYGPVTASFERIGKFWETILNVSVTAEQVGLCMIALKMSRQISKSGRDNLVDIAGYAGCIAKMEEESQQQ